MRREGLGVEGKEVKRWGGEGIGGSGEGKVLEGVWRGRYWREWRGGEGIGGSGEGKVLEGVWRDGIGGSEEGKVLEGVGRGRYWREWGGEDVERVCWKEYHHLFLIKSNIL